MQAREPFEEPRSFHRSLETVRRETKPEGRGIFLFRSARNEMHNPRFSLDVPPQSPTTRSIPLQIKCPHSLAARERKQQSVEPFYVFRRFGGGS